MCHFLLFGRGLGVNSSIARCLYFFAEIEFHGVSEERAHVVELSSAVFLDLRGL
jgi:hypothetical protein